MRFDEWWPEDDATADSGADLPMPSDGVHVGEVRVARWEEKPFRVSDRNPKGVCLNLCIRIPKFSDVWADVPVQLRGVIEAVCRSASVHPPRRGEDWNCEVLKGRAVTIETRIGVSQKTGREFIRIESWKPGPEPLPEAIAKAPPRQAPKRAQSAKAHAHFKEVASNDDIPF